VNSAQSLAAVEHRRGGKLRLAHYKGSLVIVKPFRGDVAPTVTQLDKVEMTAVRFIFIFIYLFVVNQRHSSVQ